ncbi:MAG: hypothetical protein Fur0035_03030 [Anaerolineales bacterium]
MSEETFQPEAAGLPAPEVSSAATPAAPELPIAQIVAEAQAEAQAYAFIP